MSSLKSAFVMAVLLAIGYGVYVMLVKSPNMPLADREFSSAWSPTKMLLTPEATSSLGTAAHVPSYKTQAQSTLDNVGLAVDASSVATTDPSPDAQNASDTNTFSTTSSSVYQANSVAQAVATTSDESAPSSYAALANSVPHHQVDQLPAEDSQTRPIFVREPASSAVQVGEKKTDSAAVTRDPFEGDWRNAHDQLTEGNLVDALFTLSMWYSNSDISLGQRQKLVTVLDQLAGSVIYSTQHMLQPPYQVRDGETLEEIARHFKIPGQFLENVNGIHDSNSLVIGQEIKVVHGPFRAEVDLDRRELTLFLGRFYAGRLAIQIGQNPFPNPGSYDVLDKKLDGRDFIATDGTLIPAKDPTNPYSVTSLGLSNGLVLHGDNPSAGSTNRGCIILSQRDASDLYAILSEGSRVVIREATPVKTATAPMSSLGSATIRH